MNRIVQRAAAILLLAFGGGCGQTLVQQGQGRQTLTIFAASSLTDSMTELVEAFAAEQNNVEVSLNFGGSSQLALQLREGARADLFASANPAQMDAVVANGRVAEAAPVAFANNRLALIVPVDNPAGVTGWRNLGEPGVQLIVAAPGVPVRTYTDVMVNVMPATFQQQFYANIVSEEPNVRQVAAKVALGEADAGMVYVTDVTPEIESRVLQIPLAQANVATASYLIAPLDDAAQPVLAQQFIYFVRSEVGREILQRWGFTVPKNG